jgi:hypothetical protein
MAIASLVLGIISIMCCMSLPGVQSVGLILAIIGIVLSNKNKDESRASLAKAGKVCSIVGLVGCALLLFIYIVFLNVAVSMFSTGFFEEVSRILQNF